MAHTSNQEGYRSIPVPAVLSIEDRVRAASSILHLIAAAARGAEKSDTSGPVFDAIEECASDAIDQLYWVGRSAAAGESAPNDDERETMTAAPRQVMSATEIADGEAGGFVEMFHVFSAMEGVIETLRHTVGAVDGPGDDVNWASIAYLLDDCARRMGPVHSALSQLRKIRPQDSAGRG